MSKTGSQHKTHTLTVLVLLLAGSQSLLMPARAGNDAPAAGGIEIASCSVSSTRDSNKTYDCSAQAAKVCNGRTDCEIQIGDNLTDGKNVDPASRFPQKRVTIEYDCGDTKLRQRGPYPQSNHASLILECFV